MKRKVLILLAVLMAMIVTAIPVFAAGAGSVAVSPATAETGSTVTLTLSVSDLGQVSALGITYTVPEGLEYESASWLIDGTIKNVDKANKKAAFTVDTPIVLNHSTEVFEITYKIPKSAVATPGAEKEFTAKFDVIAKLSTEKVGNFSAEAKITVKSICDHSGEKEIKNRVAETCGEKGYTGDEYCKACGEQTATGSYVPATGKHTGGTATCTAQAICDTCKKPYGDKLDHSYAKEWTTDETKHWHVCSACKKAKADEANHEFQWVTDTPATEVATGIKHEECTVCKVKRNEGTVIDKLDHKHTGGTATCTAEAICDTCKKPYGDKLDHSYADAWTTSDSEHWHLCTICKTDKSDVGAHNFQWIIDTPATEQTAGVKHEECSVCKMKRSEGTAIDKLGHTHTGITKHEAVAATCTTAGNVEYWTCSSDKCSGKYYGDAACSTELKTIATEIDKKNHTGATEIKNQKDATCNAAGYTGDTYCKACGDLLTAGKEIPATGKHNGGTATCTEQAVCSTCKQPYGEKRNHRYSSRWESDDKQHWHLCATCGEAKSGVGEHNFQWVVDQPATESASGLKHEECVVCHKVRNENTVIDKLDHTHNYQAKVTNPTCTEDGYTTYSCACGDSYVGDMVAAIGHDYADGVCKNCGEKEPVVKVNAPQILSCYSKVQTAVKVTWATVEGADGYELWRSVTPADESSWIRAKTIADGSKDRYTNQGLSVGITYYYKIRAYVEDAEGNRTYSDFSAVDYMPAAVTWDGPYSNATFRIRLRWNEIGGAHGYQIWRQDENGEWRIVKTLGDKGNTLTDNQGATNAYSNTGLEAGKNYTYKIRAFMITEDGRKVFGAYSDAFTVAVMPEAPVVAVSSTKEGRAQLSWEEVNGAAGYQVWMLDGDEWKIVKSIADGSTTYTKYDLHSGAEYQFKVRAYTEVNGKKTFGDYSKIGTVIVK